MQKKSLKYQRVLYALLLCFLLAPLLESNFSLIEVKKLYGAITNKDTIPKFSVRTWIDGTYQRQEEQVVHDSFGFRNICVRINNQVEYSLFNLNNSPDIAIGKKGYLYTTHSIDDIYGSDFLGSPIISEQIKKLEFINDTLTKLGKTFILVIAPHKGMVYPEYLPAYPYPFRDTTNYSIYLKYLKKSNIHYIDFNSYFIANRDKFKYPIEPKTGVHWSFYGSALVGDSLLHYIETAQHITLPKPIWKSIKISNGISHDIDAESTLNLLFDINTPEMAYPEIKCANNSQTVRPRAMIVGDSFYIELIEGYDINNVFADGSKYWYYFNATAETKLSQLQVKDEINKSKVVMLVTAEYSLTHMGWGFLDTAYCMLKNTSPVRSETETYSERLNEIIKGAKIDDSWLRKVEDMALEKGIPLDSAIIGNARWVLDNEAKK